MAYGSPTTLDDVEAYYTDIRRGRPPTTSENERSAGRGFGAGLREIFRVGEPNARPRETEE